MEDSEIDKETMGAWIVHHGHKIRLDANASTEFPKIDEAAKAANLLVRLGETGETTLNTQVVKAVARSAGLNPGYELEGLLAVLKDRRLIDRGGDEVVVLGVTTRSVLARASELFEDAEPSKAEKAVIHIAEAASKSPISQADTTSYVSDNFQLTNSESVELIDQSTQLGFVDAEGDRGEQILFNGHLFRRDNLNKANRVLNSLSSAEQSKLVEFGDLLQSSGCLPLNEALTILGEEVFYKLQAASLYDTHTVSNENGENVFVTSPGAFHKFVDPLVDDTFDMAKALVAALYYGMTKSSYVRGRVTMIDRLLSKLISGGTVGPATAIGQDYRVLEQNRVVQITRTNGRFSMKLLKREVGELALQVLRSGDANATSVVNLPNAPMSGYVGPEGGRVRLRKSQSTPSKRQTLDVLTALRSGRSM